MLDHEEELLGASFLKEAWTSVPVKSSQVVTIKAIIHIYVTMLFMALLILRSYSVVDLIRANLLQNNTTSSKSTVKEIQMEVRAFGIIINMNFEKRIKHYTSHQKILLVGEGDFSFSLCLARAFGSAINMVATSLDSRELLMVKYSKAMTNVKELEDRGCVVLHEVNVHRMSQHPFLSYIRFDRIIYNFPHAGYLRCPSPEQNQIQIWFHQDLVRGFFKNAREMLTGIGEIHVRHKTTFPFNEWRIVNLAEGVGLYLVHEEEFSKWDYPGYYNKKGVGGICDESFPVGESSTFMFAKRLYRRTRFHPGALSISTWSAEIVDMACTYLDSLEMKKCKRGRKAGGVCSTILDPYY